MIHLVNWGLLGSTVALLAFVVLLVSAIVKRAMGGRYANMTEEDFEREAKRKSRMTNEMMKLQTIYAPSHEVERIQEQGERLEVDGAESGGNPDTGPES